MKFVDTNYFLRFFLKDNPDQYLIASDLFTRASSGKEELFTDTVVVFEIYWVLKSYYGAKHLFVKKTLNQICHFDFLYIENREIILDAINNFDKFNYDLEDAYHFYYAQSKGINKVATFDKKLEKMFRK